MSKCNEPYDYYYHTLSVAIFEWAESQVMRPHLPREYFDEQLKWALTNTRSKNIDWLPISESYKGQSQKRKDTIYIAVEMGNGQSYGFSFYKPNALKIDEILSKLWRDYIHQEVEV